MRILGISGSPRVKGNENLVINKSDYKRRNRRMHCMGDRGYPG
jgi:hypothetical protein